jgi:uncharacterized protein YndB with AHSA1/START domain
MSRGPRPTCSMEVRGDRATLVIRRFLHHPPSVVWKAITDPDQIRQWYLTTASVEERTGGKIDFVTGDAWVHATGRVLRWDPPRVYEHTWNVAREESRFQLDEQTVVRWELTPHEGGTLLVLTHRDLKPKTAETFQHGLPGFIERLEALLDGEPLPDWNQLVQESRRGSGAPG